MDPNENLREQRRIAARILVANAGADDARTLRDAERLAELVEALDGWLSKRCFLPDAWAGPTA